MKKTRITESELFLIVRKIVIFTFAFLGYPRNGYKIVSHKKGSTDNTEIWKNYWEDNHPSHHFPSEPHTCPSCLTKQDDFVGGHVVCKDKTFIIPVCRKCNSEYKGSNADTHFFYVKVEDMVRAPQN